MTNETVIAILNELKKCYLGGIVDALDFAIEAVKEREPVVHGTWEVYNDCGITRCSACKWNFKSRINYKYCPNCGVKMDGEHETR